MNAATLVWILQGAAWAGITAAVTGPPDLIASLLVFAGVALSLVALFIAADGEGK